MKMEEQGRVSPVSRRIGIMIREDTGKGTRGGSRKLSLPLKREGSDLVLQMGGCQSLVLVKERPTSGGSISLRDRIRSLKPLIPGMWISGPTLSPKNLVTLKFPPDHSRSHNPLTDIPMFSPQVDSASLIAWAIHRGYNNMMAQTLVH